MEVGLNLFSLYKYIQNEDGLVSTVLRLKDMGYSYMQFSGAPFDGKMIARVAQKTGMPFTLTHVPFARIVDDTDALMEEHSLFGCTRIGLGAMPSEAFADIDVCKKTIEKLNRAAERMASQGFSFYYHNHHVEFLRRGNYRPIEDMLENAPYINFTLDTFWVHFGGYDVIELIKRLKGRVGCIHFKDYNIDKKESDPWGLGPVFAPVGTGNLDFKKILVAARYSGTDMFFVEQDNACEAVDPFGEVEKSINYIKGEL